MNAIKHTRIPVALTLAVLLTGSMFTLLQDLTTAAFEPSYTPTVPIKLLQPRTETDPETKRPEKVVMRETPDIDIPLLPPTGRTRDEPTVTVRQEYVPVVTGTETLSLGTDRDVAPLVRINPVYPQRLADRGIEGWVRVRYNVSVTGGVTDVEVIASEPPNVFDKAATDAVARWRYNPKVENATSVERRGMETLLRFDLNE